MVTQPPSTPSSSPSSSSYPSPPSSSDSPSALSTTSSATPSSSAPPLAPTSELWQQLIAEEKKNWVFNNPNLTEIVPGVFLGNAGASCNPDLLANHGITAMISLGTEKQLRNWQTRWVGSINHLVSEERHWTVEIKDVSSENLLMWLEDLTQKISVSVEEGAGHILVHCEFGISRSPAVVIAWLMAKQGMSVEAAKQFVKERRGCVNTRFTNQLRVWEACGFELLDAEGRSKRPYLAAADHYGWDLYDDDEDDEDDDL